MFDMQKIGKKIAGLRKANNLTQLELADKLGISYQAVSNWERGDSMPDISKLEDISKIFDISIDDLLENDHKTKVIHNIRDNKMVGDAPAEDIKDVLPLFSPKDVEETIKNVKFPDKSALDTKKAEMLRAFAPFLSEKTLEEIYFENVNDLEIEALTDLAPFMSTLTLEKIVFESQFVNIDNLPDLAPFLSSKCLHDFCFKEMSKETFNIDAFSDLAPFLDSKDMNSLFDNLKSFHNYTFEQLEELLPFLESDVIDKTISSVTIDDVDSIESVLPFASSKALKTMCDNIFAKKGNNTEIMSSVFPFLDEDDLNELVKKVMQNNPEDFEFVVTAAPFMSESHLGEIVIAMLDDGDFNSDNLLQIIPFLDDATQRKIINKYFSKKN